MPWMRMFQGKKGPTGLINHDFVSTTLPFSTLLSPISQADSRALLAVSKSKAVKCMGSNTGVLGYKDTGRLRIDVSQQTGIW
jgi:hypothetical protein